MGRLFRISLSRPEKPRPFIAGLSLGRLLAVGILLGLGLWLHGLVGLLLLLAGTDLATSRQPFASRPVCWPALGFTAVGMLLVGPAVAFACGWLVELVCDPVLAAWQSANGPGEPRPVWHRPPPPLT
jgi:hypothetical protein